MDQRSDANKIHSSFYSLYSLLLLLVGPCYVEARGGSLLFASR